MNRHIREIKKIVRLLKSGPQHSETILEHLNSTGRYGSSMAILSNLLAKNPKLFVKLQDGYNVSAAETGGVGLTTWKSALWAAVEEEE